MGSTAAFMSGGELFSWHPIDGARTGPGVSARSFRLEVADDVASRALQATLPLLGRILTEKLASAREHQLEEMVDFLAARLVTPSPTELDMAQRLAHRHARVLNEFGYLTAEQLAQANHSRAGNRAALADNWKKRRRVFAVPHPDRALRERDVYPAFQFEDGKPLAVVQQVLDAFGGRKSPWKLALWFTSANGWLPDSARPVDLLTQDPAAVAEAARRDAQDSAV